MGGGEDHQAATWRGILNIMQPREMGAVPDLDVAAVGRTAATALGLASSEQGSGGECSAGDGRRGGMRNASDGRGVRAAVFLSVWARGREWVSGGRGGVVAACSWLRDGEAGGRV